MKNIKIFIVTYRRPKILNKTLARLFNETDFASVSNTEVYIINNHSDFHLDEQFVNKVSVLHNQARPNWDMGNLSRNWNQALIHGFKDLNNPDSKIVVTMQNDIVLSKNWCTNLLKMHKKYDFITGQYGDNIVSYRPSAVKKIGLWDERFITPNNKEADYYIRALIFNKQKSLINDKAHNRLLNNHDGLDLDGKEYLGSEPEWKKYKKSDLNQQGWYHTSQIFYWKWKDTWKTQPSYYGWLTNWTDDFVKNPPSVSKMPNFVQYYYFEKDVETLEEQNYVGWRDGDCWLDANKCENINIHPFKKGERFRK